MNDLLVGILIVGLLSALLLVAGLRVSKILGARASNLLAILIVAMIVAYDLFVEDNVALTHYLPFSNAIVLGNLVPLLVAALAGLIWRRIPGRWMRRTIVMGSLALACLAATYRPIVGVPPTMEDRWQGGICLQTSPASCTPAAAATLLHLYGIKSTEQEMALLCLTSPRGTSMLGLWRGLKLKTAESDWDVYMFNNQTVPQLHDETPALISVELYPDAPEAARKLHTSGWYPGVPHSVVVLGFTDNGRAIVADPATGAETWPISDLHILWHGVGAKLVRHGKS